MRLALCPIPLVAALLVAAPCAAAIPEIEVTPSSPSGAPSGGETPTAVAPADEPPPRSPARTALLVAGGVLLLEGIVAGYSGLAAYHPRTVGWSEVIVAPLTLGAESSLSAPAAATGAAALAAMGLYNALELRGDRYSRSDRFWRNVIGWHALFGAMAGVEAAFGRPAPKRAASDPLGARLSLALALPAGETPHVVLAGRF